MDIKIIGELNNSTISALFDAYLTGADEIEVAICSEGGNTDVSCAFVDLFSPWRRAGSLGTVAFGEVMSGAPLIVAAGSPGRRVAFMHTLFGLHLPYLDETTGDPAVQDSEFRMLQSTTDRFITLLSGLTDTTERTWRKRLKGKSMVIFDAKQAKKWGIIDNIEGE